MILPLILFALSLSLLAVSYLFADLADLFLLAVPATLASLWLVVSTGLRRWREGPRAPAGPVVIDGSNVMHWRDETPQMDTLREVIRHLSNRGFKAGVVFDANASYKLAGKYLDERALARRLSLPRDNVIVVDKGTPADPILLEVARDLGARVVSNDQFRDWAFDHPEIREPGHLIRGGYRNGKLWLDIG
ncbi:NYN domain-containing protein [Tropicimonas aquimaris]|uniref:RNase NYN domain-containing protein n=1 Tax=Tropicimonas aquimaris TaxID=914152 RepID=A0ABW3IX29_9RHOB